MKQSDYSSEGESSPEFDPEEVEMNDLVNQGVEAAARGENADQLFEVMQSQLPMRSKETLRRKFAAALAKRGLRQLSGDADVPSRQTLSRLRKSLLLSAQQMVERIVKLLLARPDLAARVKQAGQTLLRHGVAADKVVPISETELGTISPSVASGRGQDQRGRTG